MRSLVVLALVLALPASAVAQGTLTGGGTIEEAASALRSDPLYVAPDAERKLDAAEQERVRQAIRRSAGGPICVGSPPASSAASLGSTTT